MLLVSRREAVRLGIAVAAVGMLREIPNIRAQEVCAGGGDGGGGYETCSLYYPEGATILDPGPHLDCSWPN